MIKVTWKGGLLRLPATWSDTAAKTASLDGLNISFFFNPRDDNIPTSIVT